jgi:DNA-directed RNA polymerase specialized sigma subunit
MHTEFERNELAKKYLPLVKKISNQFLNSSPLEYDEIEGFAWEGFVLAMNKYDQTKSDMSFTSYAAFGIKNAIMNGINSSGQTIAVSLYNRKKMTEKGENIPTSVSLEKNFENEDHLLSLGFEDDVIFDNPWKVMLDKVKSNFDEEYVDIFCSIYGLDGHDVEKGKDIAERLGISGCLVTKRTKKIIDFIKNDKELSSILRDLL